MTCSTDRWTCPSCGRTVVVIAGDPDTRVALEAVQERHARGHRTTAPTPRDRRVLARLGLPDPK